MSVSSSDSQLSSHHEHDGNSLDSDLHPANFELHTNFLHNNDETNNIQAVKYVKKDRSFMYEYF